MTSYSNINAGTLPSSGNWRIAASPSKFFAIASISTAAASSTDGLSWVSKTLPATASSTTYQNGNFFFSNSTAMYMSDDGGDTWNGYALPSSGTWLPPVWNGSVYVTAKVNTTSVATSVDGTSWSPITLPISGFWFGLAWNGAMFCLCSANTGQQACYSVDGSTWFAGGTPAYGCGNYGLIAVGSLFVSGVASGVGGVITSTDAVTWSYTDGPNYFSYGLSSIGNTVCLPVGATKFVSLDVPTLSFTEISLPSYIQYPVSAASGDTFCIVGGNTSDVSMVATLVPGGPFWKDFIGTRSSFT